MHHLVGVTEIAAMLGVTRQRADQLTRRGDFPKPEATISAGRIWKKKDVERWARQKGRMQ